jgi:riboflavin transporter FmnP
MTTKSRIIAGTAILAALVVVFDYTMKFSGFKIRFPLLPDLKFDFTGIPIVLSLLFYGLPSASATSVVALLAIVARSGDVVSASMKTLAEFSTILGMTIGLRFFKDKERYIKPISLTLGIAIRTLVMFFANLSILPLYYFWMTFEKALIVSPSVAAFNIVQGFLSIFGGYLIYEAIERRMPYVKNKYFLK